MRKANMDRRLRLDKQVMDSIQAHGIAGLFIDPENALVCLSSSQSRISPRRGTAFHHTHLPERNFETIAKSLAEGVSVTATARIQNDDKKTVLLVLAKASEQAKRVRAVQLEIVHKVNSLVTRVKMRDQKKCSAWLDIQLKL